MNIFKNILIVVLLIATGVLSYTNFKSSTQLEQANKEVSKLNNMVEKERINDTSLSNVNEGQATLDGFVTAAFEYSSIKDDRYERAKEFGTENGIKSMNPSSTKEGFPTLPKNILYESKVKDKKIYFTPSKDGETGNGLIIFDNEMKINNQSSSSKIFLECKLVYDKKQHKYLVDETNVVSQSSSYKGE
ncbi:TPA: hypothetical protein QCR51_005171 [Bacillus cereus]|nr:hypothetical protein [Bacillus cereus]